MHSTPSPVKEPADCLLATFIHLPCIAGRSWRNGLRQASLGGWAVPTSGLAVAAEARGHHGLSYVYMGRSASHAGPWQGPCMWPPSRAG